MNSSSKMPHVHGTPVAKTDATNLPALALCVVCGLSKLSLLLLLKDDSIGTFRFLWLLLWHWPAIFAADIATCTIVVVSTYLLASHTRRGLLWFMSFIVLLHALILRTFAVPVDWKIVTFIGTHPGLFLLNLPMAGTLGRALQWAMRLAFAIALTRGSLTLVKLMKSKLHALDARLEPFLRNYGSSSRRLAAVLVSLCAMTVLSGLAMICASAALPPLVGVRVLQWLPPDAEWVPGGPSQCRAQFLAAAVGLTCLRRCAHKKWQMFVLLMTIASMILAFASVSQGVHARCLRMMAVCIAASAAIVLLPCNINLLHWQRKNRRVEPQPRIALRGQLPKQWLSPTSRKRSVVIIVFAVLTVVMTRALGVGAAQSTAENQMLRDTSHYRANPILRLGSGALVAMTKPNGGEEELNVSVRLGAPARPLNVIVFMLESVRAASLPMFWRGRSNGIYGEDPITPFLAAWERRDKHVRVWRGAHCAVPNTMKSMFSLHCGLPPALGVEQREYFSPKLLQGCLPAALGHHGYKTAYLTSGSVGYQGRLGFDETFDGDAAEALARDGGKVPVQKRFERSHYMGLEDRVLVPAVDAWLDSVAQPSSASKGYSGTHTNAKAKPFFLTLGTVSTHFPYTLPSNWTVRSLDHTHTTPAPCRRNHASSWVGAATYQQKHDSAAAAYNCFLNGVAYIDTVLRDIVSLLQRRDLLQTTVIVVASDHGEHFAADDGRALLHGASLEDGDTRVPLIMRVPPLLHRSRRQKANRTDAAIVGHDAKESDATTRSSACSSRELISLSGVYSLIAEAIHAHVSANVSSTSARELLAGLRTGSTTGSKQHKSQIAMANLYGTALASVRTHPCHGNGNAVELRRCIEDSSYAVRASPNCSVDALWTLHKYRAALDNLYRNVRDTGPKAFGGTGA